MSVTSLHINGKVEKVTCDDQTPLLWVLRDHLGLTGTKFGCGRGLCGACTVHVDGESTRSCSIPVSAVKERRVLTIEGLAKAFPKHPLFLCWKQYGVAQCGYCQPGQIMTAAANFQNQKSTDLHDIKSKSEGNICRYGTYLRIQQAIKSAGEKKV